MPLIKLTAEPAPRVAGWLVPGENCTDLEYRVVCRAWPDIGILERPAGSNRGIRIDKMTRRTGLKPPVFWCAIWAGLVMADAGALVPQNFPDCDTWLPYLSPIPRNGSAVLYGKPGDARHIGIVTRIEKDGIWTIEGNRGIPGEDKSRTNNGEGVFHGKMFREDVLGYFHARSA